MPTKTQPLVIPIDDANPYLSLVRRFPLRPIRSDEQLDEAIEMIRHLGSREDLIEAEEDYQHVLGTLIGEYEAEHVTLPADVPGREMLRHLIESRDLTQAAVSQATGIAPSSLNEMIAGKRRIGPVAMRKLGDYFRINPSVFL